MIHITTKKSTLNFLFIVLFSLALTFIIEAITRNGLWFGWNFLQHHFKKFLFNSSIVLLTLIPLFLFKRRLFYISLISVIWIIFSVADNLVLKFRGTPLTGSDLLMLKNGIDLASDYLSSSTLILLILVLVIITSLLVFLFIKGPKVKVNYKFYLPFVLIFILIFPSITNYAITQNIVSTNFWDITNMFNEYGFPYSFLHSIINTGLNKPSNYSKEEINKLKDSLYIDFKKEPTIKPNIIFIQLESFMDPTYINDVQFDKDPIPNFRALKERYSSGLLYVPSLGGGTANTEFEIITGMSSEFFGTGEFPFNTVLLNKTVNCSGYMFNALGYDTSSLHNHEATFYNRYKVYRNLGFRRFVPLETMSNFEKTSIGWAKDNVLINEILNCLNNSTYQDYIYAISVQGHGPYPNTPLTNKEINILSTFDEGNKNSYEYYVNVIKEMDNFIADLITAVSSLNEPSVIVMYGDHTPGLGIPSEKINTGNLYTTDYVIWDNLNFEKTSKDLEAFQLTSYLLQKLNFPLNYLSQLHNSKSNSIDYKNTLYLLEYDILYGKNYINNEFFNEPIANYTIGLYPPKILNLTLTDDNLLISGNNFNTFSRVYVNNKEVESTYFNSTSLSIMKKNITPGDSIKVKQISPNKTILNTSEEYNYK